jgi:hypothetical protein
VNIVLQAFLKQFKVEDLGERVHFAPLHLEHKFHSSILNLYSIKQSKKSRNYSKGLACPGQRSCYDFDIKFANFEICKASKNEARTLQRGRIECCCHIKLLSFMIFANQDE